MPSRYSSTLDSAHGAALAVDDLASSYWVSKLDEENPFTLTVELDDLAAGAQLHSELSELEAADAALAAAVTKLAEVMPDVHACKKKSAGFSKKSKSREGFFRKVLGTAELAEKKVFFDVAHAERLNKPSSFMLVGCVSATRATSEMCLSCREINGQIKFSSATCACVKQKGCPFLLQVVTKPRAKIAKG